MLTLSSLTRITDMNSCCSLGMGRDFDTTLHCGAPCSQVSISWATSSNAHALTCLILNNTDITIDSKARWFAAEGVAMLHFSVNFNVPAIGALAPLLCNTLFGMPNRPGGTWSPAQTLAARIRHHAPVCVRIGRLAAGIMALSTALHCPIPCANAPICSVPRAIRFACPLCRALTSQVCDHAHHVWCLPCGRLPSMVVVYTEVQPRKVLVHPTLVAIASSASLAISF